MSSSRTWSASTPKLTLDWRPIEDVMLFVTFSEGFKSGGFSGLGATEEIARRSFGPEFAKNYEVGTKSQLFEDRVRLNLSVFRTDFEDLQLRDRFLRDCARGRAHGSIKPWRHQTCVARNSHAPSW